MKQLSQEALKAALHYCPETGIFTYLVDTRFKKAGEVAGYFKSQGYRDIHINGCNYYAHRLAFLYMTGSFPELHVDHRNNDRTDNRWCNLRQATSAENNRNRAILKTNTSGVTGVCWETRRKKWSAYVYKDKKRHDLGCFESIDEAARVVAEARKALHGEFAFSLSTI